MRRWFPLVVLLLPVQAFGQIEDPKEVTVRYILKLQQPDGGFIPAPQDPKLDQVPRSSLRATSAAVRALKYFGGQVPKPDAVAKFVKSCFDDATGSFSDTPQGKGDVFITAVGLMAVTELKMPAEPYTSKGVEYLTKNAKGFEDIRIAAAGFETVKKFPPEMKKWLEDVDAMRNKDGSFGKPEGNARMTGSVVALILRSGGTMSDDHRKAALAVLQKGQLADGGFGKDDAKTSDLETTYRVMRAFHLLKEKPKDADKLWSFIASCRKPDGGYCVEPGKPTGIGPTYYAGILRYWLTEKVK